MKLFAMKQRGRRWSALLAGTAWIFAFPAVVEIDVAEAASRATAPSGFEEQRITGDDKLIREVQELLSDMDIFRGAINGRASRQLEDAIRLYQRRTGRKVTGLISDDLIKHLDTQSRVGVMLRRLDKTRESSKAAARRALLDNERTRGFLSEDAPKEVADPTRDATPCFRNPNETCLLLEALESAKAIAKSELRDWALGEILVSQAKAGLVEDAIATVRRIGDARLIIVALRDIAQAQAKAGMVEDALAAAAIIPDVFKRLEALASIADIQLTSGERDRALETAARIAFQARSLKSPLQRVSLFAQMAVVFTKAGNPQGGDRLLEDAQEIVRSPTFARKKGGTDRGAALRHIAAAYSEIGQPRHALSIMDGVTGTYDRTAVLMSAATAHAAVGDTAAALETASHIDSPRYLAVTLGRVAVSQAKQGDHRSAAKTITLALEQARKIKMPYARSYAIGQLSLSLAQIGANRSDGVLIQAVETTHDIENQRLRAYALWTVAAAQANQGQAADMARTTALAEEATTNIVSSLSRVWMFGDLAAEHARAGNRGQALEAFRRGLDMAENIRNSWGRARALAKLAGVLHDIQ